jgi:hypothetical protein
MNYARSRHQMIARALELGIILDMPNRPEGELRRDPIAAQEYRSPCDEYRECRRVMRETIFFIEKKMEPDLESRKINDAALLTLKDEENLP